MRRMIRIFRSGWTVLRSEHGGTLLESALSWSVLLAVLLGIFQVSLALYAYHVMSDAAREGSRYAMVRGSTSCANTPNLSNCNATSTQIQSFVRTLTYPGITSSKITVTTTWYTVSSSTPAVWSACTTSPCNLPGNQVNVSVTYPFLLNVPFSSLIPLNLSASSAMVIAQ